MQRSPKAKVTGVDYSPVSVEKSRSVNADAIAIHQKDAKHWLAVTAVARD